MKTHTLSCRHNSSQNQDLSDHAAPEQDHEKARDDRQIKGGTLRRIPEAKGKPTWGEVRTRHFSV